LNREATLATSRAGTARIDITPDGPVMLAGFGQRTKPSDGILDRIFVKALFLDDGQNRLLLITADLISTPRPLGDAVTAALGEQLGLTPDQICICASHTHSGPTPHDAGDGATGVAGFAASLQAAMIAVGVQAVEAARPCTVRAGVGQLDGFLNRRTRGAPNLVDKRIPVVMADDAATGEPIAVLFGAGCHPVTLGWDNMKISGDFVGHAQRAIEAATPGVNAMFFNTTEGNVVPITSPNRDALDPRGYVGGAYADTLKMGDDLAGAVLEVMATARTPSPLRVSSERQTLFLKPNFADYSPEAAAALLADARETLARYLGPDLQHALPPGPLWSVASDVVVARDLSEDEMRELMIACCRYLGLHQRRPDATAPRPVKAPVQVMRINDFELLALPGEVMVEVGQACATCRWPRISASRRRRFATRRSPRACSPVRSRSPWTARRACWRSSGRREVPSGPNRSHRMHAEVFAGRLPPTANMV
jgi:neutral ceramidase